MLTPPCPQPQWLIQSLPASSTITTPTTITTINHGVDGLVGTMAAELAPIRVNALHPGIVGDSPFWAPKTEALEATKAKTPTRRLVVMRDRRKIDERPNVDVSVRDVLEIIAGEARTDGAPRA